METRTTTPARDFQREAQRAANRHYQKVYRQRSPEKKRANNLRYYARQLVAAGYTVTAPAAAGRVAV
jgi:type II secretory pathway component PulL